MVPAGRGRLARHEKRVRRTEGPPCGPTRSLGNGGCSRVRRRAARFEERASRSERQLAAAHRSPTWAAGNGTSARTSSPGPTSFTASTVLSPIVRDYVRRLSGATPPHDSERTRAAVSDAIKSKGSFPLPGAHRAARRFDPRARYDGGVERRRAGAIRGAHSEPAAIHEERAREDTISRYFDIVNHMQFALVVWQLDQADRPETCGWSVSIPPLSGWWARAWKPARTDSCRGVSRAAKTDLPARSPRSRWRSRGNLSRYVAPLTVPEIGSGGQSFSACGAVGWRGLGRHHERKRMEDSFRRSLPTRAGARGRASRNCRRSRRARQVTGLKMDVAWLAHLGEPRPELRNEWTRCRAFIDETIRRVVPDLRRAQARRARRSRARGGARMAGPGIEKRTGTLCVSNRAGQSTPHARGVHGRFRICQEA